MQLVINISSNHYEALKEMSNVGLGYYYEAILNGTPLPQKHGGLIDVEELKQNIIAHKHSIDFCKEHHIDQAINLGMLNMLLTDAPIIVEESEE